MYIYSIGRPASSVYTPGCNKVFILPPLVPCNTLILLMSSSQTSNFKLNPELTTYIS